MKKIFTALLLAALLLALTACDNKTAGTDVPAGTDQTAVTEAPAADQEKAEPSAGEIPVADLVKAAAADAGNLAPFSAEDLADMAGIDAADCADFVFLQGDGMDGREILVIRAENREAADRLTGQMESYLERRKEEMENYAPKAYQLYSAAKVERKNLLLVLISGENAGTETETILAGE